MSKDITATEIKKRYDDFNYKMSCDADKFLEPLIQKTWEVLALPNGDFEIVYLP